MRVPRLLLLAFMFVSLLAIACSSSKASSNTSSSTDGLYQCTVGQTRCGGGEKWPPGFDALLSGSSQKFQMTLTGTHISVPGYFECDGHWIDMTDPTYGKHETVLACTLPTGTSCAQGQQTNVPWAVVTAGIDPNNGHALTSGQVWAGEYPGVPPTNLSALCTR